MNDRGQAFSWLWGMVVAGIGFLLMMGLYIILKDIQQNNLHATAINGGADTSTLGVFEGILYAWPIALLLGLALYAISTASQTRGY